jgi:hypothetical protein
MSVHGILTPALNQGVESNPEEQDPDQHREHDQLRNSERFSRNPEPIDPSRYEHVSSDQFCVFLLRGTCAFVVGRGHEFHLLPSEKRNKN